MVIREADAGDRAQLAAIESALPFLQNRFLLACSPAGVAALLAWRQLAPGEREILQIETLPAYRRLGLARRLLRELKRQEAATIFLEVRQSNAAALHLYETEGFQQVGIREGYYSSPPENGIVLRFRPC